MAIEQSTSNRPSILPQQTERISFIESYGNYVKVYFDSGEHKIIRSSLKSLSNSLPKSWFSRIHNQRIINLSRIEIVNHTTQGVSLKLKENEVVFIVSRTYSKAFVEAYQAFALSDIPFAKNDPGYCF